MEVKKILTESIAGAVVLFLAGGLLYGLLIDDFIAENSGSATGVMKDSPDMLWLIVGNLAYGVLLSLIFGWANITTWAEGAKTGALIGLLFALFVDTMMYATTNIYTLVSMAADILAMTLMSAAGGAAIGFVAGKTKK